MWFRQSTIKNLRNSSEVRAKNQSKGSCNWTTGEKTKLTVLKNVVRTVSKVDELAQKTVLEISDFDSCSTHAEIEEALRTTLSSHIDNFEIRLTKPNARQQRLTFIRQQEFATEKLLQPGRALIGFVSRKKCGIEAKRCLGYSHCSGTVMWQWRSQKWSSVFLLQIKAIQDGTIREKIKFQKILRKEHIFYVSVYFTPNDRREEFMSNLMA